MYGNMSRDTTRHLRNNIRGLLQKTTDHIPIPEWKDHKDTVTKPESVEMKEMPKEEQESPSPVCQVKRWKRERESPALNGEEAFKLKAEDELQSEKEEPDVPEPDTLARETARNAR